MELIGMTLKTNIYIQSEAEFNRARAKGVWEIIRSLITGRHTHLLPFGEMANTLCLEQAISLGVQDIPIKNINGSIDRSHDFTRDFLPRINNEPGKERWRLIYTLAVTGKGFPPVKLYKMGQNYIVKDGHHRISVANYLAWQTIQAHVIELPAPPPPHPPLDKRAGKFNSFKTNGVQIMLTKLVPATMLNHLVKWVLSQEAKFRDRLQYLAFQVAVMRAYQNFAQQHPEWTASLFDEYFLMHHPTKQLLAHYLQPAAPPTPGELALAWLNQLGPLCSKKIEARSAEVTPIAADFLHNLEAELQNYQVMWQNPG